MPKLNTSIDDHEQCIHRIQYLVDYIDKITPLKDGGFTFPDGDFWETENKHAESSFAEIPCSLSISEHNIISEALDKCIRYGGSRTKDEYAALRDKLNTVLLAHMKKESK